VAKLDDYFAEWDKKVKKKIGKSKPTTTNPK